MIIQRDMVFIKTITFDKPPNEEVYNLHLLKDLDFNMIKIPKYKFSCWKNVLTIQMEYIKGEQVTPATAPQFKNIVLRDLVNSPNPISAAGYAPSNFIFNNEGLYFVDLEDMREISKEDRMKKFLKEPKNGWIK